MAVLFLLLMFLSNPNFTATQEDGTRLYPELFITTRKCQTYYNSAVRNFKDCYSDEGSCSNKEALAKSCSKDFGSIRCPPLYEYIATELKSVWSRFYVFTSTICPIPEALKDFNECYDLRLAPAQNQCRLPPDSRLRDICRSDSLSHVMKCYLSTAARCSDEGYEATEKWLKFIADEMICGKSKSNRRKSGNYAPTTSLSSFILCTIFGSYMLFH